MKTDRLKFRVWDNKNKCFCGNCALNEDGDLLWSDQDGEELIIEQCTGAKDETGKLVFENDVVLVFNPMTEQQNKCVVEWCKDASGYVCRYLEPEKVQRGCAFASESGTYFDGISCRVIGNIHEVDQ